MRPRMRPPVLCAMRNTGISKYMEKARQTAHQWARNDGMVPPDFWNGWNFCLITTACIPLQPCYNPARLENGAGACQGQKNASCPLKFLILTSGKTRAAISNQHGRTLLKDRRRGPESGNVALGDPLVGKPWIGAAAAHREQIPALYRG